MLVLLVGRGLVERDRDPADSRARLVTLSLDNDDASVRGSVVLADNAVASLTLDRLRLGGNDFAGTMRRAAGSIRHARRGRMR